MVIQAKGRTPLTLSLEQQASRVFLDSTLMMPFLVQLGREKEERNNPNSPAKLEVQNVSCKQAFTNLIIFVE